MARWNVVRRNIVRWCVLVLVAFAVANDTLAQEKPSGAESSPVMATGHRRPRFIGFVKNWKPSGLQNPTSNAKRRTLCVETKFKPSTSKISSVQSWRSSVSIPIALIWLSRWRTPSPNMPRRLEAALLPERNEFLWSNGRKQP